MWSILSGICAFFSAAMVGLWLKRRLLSKACFWSDYYEYLVFVTEKISYEKMPITEINREFSSKKKDQFQRLLCGETPNVPLSEESLSDVINYISGIGKTDVDTQIASLQSKASEVKKYVENECEKFRKDGVLYFKLSVLIGIVAFIILV